MVYYNSDNFNISLNHFLQVIPKNIKKIHKKGKVYYNIACSFDIETSSFLNDRKEKCAIMYIWQFAIEDNVIMGRTWQDFIKLADSLQFKLALNKNQLLVIYVHNLSYEFQFMRKWLEWLDVFATDERKPLYAICSKGIEFRCSLRLSGYSLAKVADNLTKHKIKKLTGDLDYTLIRHSKTPLSEAELQYCINDVLIITSYIKECLEEYGNISDIPMTQTGKVRRYVRNNCMIHTEYINLIRSLTLETAEYKLLKLAFQGGFTHCNGMYATQLMDNVTSYDFTSSYPSVMIAEQYPISKGQFIGDCSEAELIEYSKNYCCLFVVRFTDIKAVTPYENIISYSKCIEIEKPIVNNGRIYKADSLITCINETDYNCIKAFYSYDDIEIHNLYIYKKDYLPRAFIQSILNLYKSKTELKGVTGSEVEYMQSKEMLNSCYGMCVTDLLNDEYQYIGDNWKTDKTDIQEAIKDYNTDKNRFLFYAWGVWVTSYARRNLYTGILECGHDYIYSDTDSIKILNADKHKTYIDTYNKLVINKLIKAMRYHNLNIELIRPKTKDNVEKPLGVWDFDGQYTRFKSLGAKRYMTETNGNKLSMTVSGVNKKTAIPYLIDKYKTNDSIFNAFNELLVIPKGYSGKNCLTYIDNEIEGVIKDYLGNYYEYKELSFIHMDSSEYNLSMASAYIDFLFRLKKHNGYV